jgi:hypothetical protein
MEICASGIDLYSHLVIKLQSHSKWESMSIMGKIQQWTH